MTGDLQKETTEPAAEEVQTEGEAQTEQPASNASFVPNDTPVTTYAMDKLNDFDYLIQNFYVVDRTTTINSSQLNAADLLNRSMKLTHGPESFYCRGRGIFKGTAGRVWFSCAAPYRRI